jgi:hypothetical protein
MGSTAFDEQFSPPRTARANARRKENLTRIRRIISLDDLGKIRLLS